MRRAIFWTAGSALLLAIAAVDAAAVDFCWTIYRLVRLIP